MNHVANVGNEWMGDPSAFGKGERLMPVLVPHPRGRSSAAPYLVVTTPYCAQLFFRPHLYFVFFLLSTALRLIVAFLERTVRASRYLNHFAMLF